jgi:LCP family protein required for cell wall assembly
MKNPFKREDPFALERKDGLFRGVAVRKPKRRFGWLRNRWVIGFLAVFVILGAVGGYFGYLYIEAQNDIQDDEIDLPETEESQPFNVLLVGSDSRAGLSEAEQQDLGADDVNADGSAITGERADTLILAQIDPETNHVTMVQFPRDLYVPIAGGGSAKVNSALEEGRPSLVQTMRDLTGLDINKYAQVNIAGFRDIVDAIDGVDVCVPEPVPFDPATGIEIKPEDVGMVHFDGEKALRFVRSRKIFANGDFGRIQNQQKFLAAAINKLTSPTTLLKFSTIKELLDVAGDNMRVDKRTTIKGLYDLSKRFRSFDPENYEAYTVPNLGIGSNEAGSVVLPDELGMKVMFDAMAKHESPAEADGVPDVDPSSILVGVYNGTDIAGLAADSAVALKEATTIGVEEIEIVEEANAERDNFKKTVIRYDGDDDEAKEKAEFIAAAVPGATVEEGKTPLGIDVAVIVGRAEFRTKKLVQIAPLKIPQPGELPDVCR